MSNITILHGDNRDQLKTLEANSIDTCVTSPPYYGLRDYQTGTWAGGDPKCTHSLRNDSTVAKMISSSTLGGGKKSIGFQQQGQKETCNTCGAIRIDNQIGMEKTPELYVAALVEVFREVKRVLKSTGTLWLNLGDSYVGNSTKDIYRRTSSGKLMPPQGRAPKVENLPPKNLIGIPWRVAFALQSDGWILRSDIIWSKPNAMPESVTDRPTKSHEYIFLFSKQEKYYYNVDAIREPHKRIWDESNGGNLADIGHKKNGKIETKQTHPNGYPLPNPLGANKRSVWTIATVPYPGAHYAVFPEKLIEPCILAGAPENGTVLDPFGGSGTTGRVAIKHKRNAVLIELNKNYLDQIDKRTDGVQISLF